MSCAKYVGILLLMVGFIRNSRPNNTGKKRKTAIAVFGEPCAVIPCNIDFSYISSITLAKALDLSVHKKYLFSFANSFSLSRSSLL